MSKRRAKKQLIDSTATIDNLSHEGRGVARIEGKAVFIDGALPGETVRFRYTASHQRFASGLVTEVISAAAQRIEAKCEHFGVCGGCNLQHLPSSDQVAHKQQTLLEQLQHANVAPPKQLLSPLTSPAWGYRYKARLGVRYVEKKARVLVGFREKNGRYLADIRQCHVLAPQIGQLITPLSAFILQLDSREHIAQLEVAIGDDACALIVRHLAPLTAADTEQWQQFAVTHNLHIYLQPAGPDTIHKLHPKDGEPYLHYALDEFGLNYAFHPTDFTQVNPFINRAMVKQAIQLLAPQAHETVLDLFCGLGNFTLPLAQRSHRVIGIEGSQQMVERASANAQANQLTNAHFYAADLSVDPQPWPWAQQQYDKILLDPPRTGAQSMVHYIDKFAANTILYVSCNPATLARDAHILQTKHGYLLDKLGVMDMFPHTSHIEAMALFVQS